MGGSIVNALPQIAGAINPIAGLTVNLGTNLLKNQFDPLAMPIPNNQTFYRGFNKGGAIDETLNSGAVLIQGNEGVDTNHRTVNGAPVRLTKEEVVTSNNSNQSPYVFSDDNSMIDPMTGKTFAQLSKEIEKSNQKAERTLRKYPNDKEAKNTVKFNKQATDNMIKRQEQMKKPEDSLPYQAMNKGGYVRKGYAVGGYIPPYSSVQALNNIVQNKMNLVDVTPNIVNVDGGNGDLSYLQLGDFYRAPRNIINPDGDLSQADRGPQIGTNAPASSTPAANTPVSNMPNFSTLGDYAYVGLKGAELLGKNILANQRVNTYNAADYRISKPVYNPNQEFQRNNQAFRANTYNVNTGNANLDRALMTTMYSANLDANAQVAERYRQMQNQSDVSIDQFNANTRMQINTINEQNSAAKYNAQDAVLTSVGNFGQVLQDMSNTRTTNRISFATLQGMAQKYRVSVDQLTQLMRNNRTQFNNMLVEYQGN